MQRENYRRHRTLGICVDCLLPATHGVYCQEHKGKRLEAQTRKNRAYYEKKKAAGLCAYCREPATAGIVCAQHRAARRATAAKKKKRRRRPASIPTVLPTTV